MWLELLGLMGASQNAFIRFAGGLATSADLSTYTFTGAAIGDVATDRFVAVVVAVKGPNTPTTVTVGGQATSGIVTAALAGNGFARLFITNAVVPTGTTANIVVNATGGLACAIAVYPIYGLQSNVATNTQSASASGGVMPLTVAEGGVVIAAALSNGTSFTPTNVTEDVDTVLEANFAFTSGRAESQIAQTLNVSFVGTGSTDFVSLAASFR